MYNKCLWPKSPHFRMPREYPARPRGDTYS